MVKEKAEAIAKWFEIDYLSWLEKLEASLCGDDEGYSVGINRTTYADVMIWNLLKVFQHHYIIYFDSLNLNFLGNFCL